MPPAHVTAAAPEAAAALDRAYVLARTAADPALLELLRIRVAQLLGDEKEAAVRSNGVDLDAQKVAALERWAGSERFSALERAALELTEQFVVYVAGVTDEQTRAVLELAGPEQLYGLVHALYAFDARVRVRLALARVLDEPAAP